MKSSKAIKIIIIGLILAVIILVFYYHISNTAKSKSEEEVQPTVVQNVLMKDLERAVIVLKAALEEYKRVKSGE